MSHISVRQMDTVTGNFHGFIRIAILVMAL